MIQYDDAYGDDSDLTEEELRARVRLLHSWVKLHQDQVNKANLLKNQYKAEIDPLKEQLKIMTNKHKNEQRMRINYVNKNVDALKVLK